MVELLIETMWQRPWKAEEWDRMLLNSAPGYLLAVSRELERRAVHSLVEIDMRSLLNTFRSWIP